MAGKRPGPSGKKAEEPTPEELEELRAAALEELEDSVEDERYDEMDEVVRERMMFSAGCLELGWPKWKIKDAIQTQYGVGRKLAEMDVGRARAKLRDDQDLSKSDMRNEIATFYRGVMSDADAAIRERLRSAKQLVEMLGLKDQSGYEPPKEDIEISLDVDWRDYYKGRLDRKEVLTAGAKAGNGATLKKNSEDDGGNGTKPSNGAGKREKKK